MEDIGGYFAKLSLVTDGASFDKARQELDAIGPAAENAGKAVEKLEAIYGGFSRKGRLYVPTGMEASKTQPSEDEGPKENEKKKSALTAASMLYVAKEIVSVAKKIISGLDKLASASIAQTAATTQNAVRTGFSAEALNKWQSALGVMKVDFGAFTSSITGVETAFNRLKVGDASAFAAIAQPLAILSSKTGRADVNPITLMGMDNEQRIKTILDAALSMSDEKTARTLLEQIIGDVGGELYAAAKTRGITTASGILAKGGLATPAPTPEAVKAADEYAKTQQNLQVFLKTFGQGLTEGMQPYLEVINSLLGAKSTLTGSENLGRMLGEILGPLIVAMGLLTKAIMLVVDIFSPSKKDPKAAAAMKPITSETIADPYAYLDAFSYQQGGPLSGTIPSGDTTITVNVDARGSTASPAAIGDAAAQGTKDAYARSKTAPGTGQVVRPAGKGAVP